MGLLDELLLILYLVVILKEPNLKVRAKLYDKNE